LFLAYLVRWRETLKRRAERVLSVHRTVSPARRL